LKFPIYVSVDVEAAGPVPGLYSLLSLGACAFERDGREIGTFYGRGLVGLAERGFEPMTWAWWLTQPEAYLEAVAPGGEHPATLTARFESWLANLRRAGEEGRQLRGCAGPSSFDAPFVTWSSWRWQGRASLLGFSWLDLRSVAEGLPAREVRRAFKQIDRTWRIGVGGTPDGPARPLCDHVAVDDAVEQARKFAALFKLIDGRPARDEKPDPGKVQGW
jgi:ribonuclease T